MTALKAASMKFSYFKIVGYLYGRSIYIIAQNIDNKVRFFIKTALFKKIIRIL